jgi:hypothetical protein
MAFRPRRPGVVTTAAVILFIVGGWSLLGACCTGASLGLMFALPAPPQIDDKARPEDPLASTRFLLKELPSYPYVQGGVLAINCLFGIGQIIGGIGLLKLRPFAPIFATSVSIGKLLFAFVGHAYAIMVVMPVQERFFVENPHIPGGNIVGMFGLFTIAGVAGVQIIIGLTIIALIYAPTAREAFAAAASPPPEGEEWQRRRDEDDD